MCYKTFFRELFIWVDSLESQDHAGYKSFQKVNIYREKNNIFREIAFCDAQKARQHEICKSSPDFFVATMKSVVVKININFMLKYTLFLND